MKRKAWIVFSITVFIVDRLLKWYFQNLPDGTVFSFLPGLNFRYSFNPALFFFPAWSWLPWVALIVLLIIFGFWILKLFRVLNFGLWISNTALLAISLGGVSNVFDRFSFGGVSDYVEIFGLASANLADILILAGLLGLIFKTKSSKSS